MTTRHPNPLPQPSAEEIQILIAEAGGKKNLTAAIASGEDRLKGAHDFTQPGGRDYSFKEGIAPLPEKRQDSDFLNKTARRAAKEHGLPAAHLAEGSTRHVGDASGAS